MPAENHQEQPGGGDHGGGNLPGNAAPEQQIDAAQKQGQRGGADNAAGVAQQNGQQLGGLALGQQRQRGCRGHAVHGVDRHHAAEGDQQEAAARQSGVHNVVAQTAEEALDHQNGKYGAQHRQVQGHFGGQGQGQQQTRYHGAAVIDGLLPLGDHIEQVLRRHGAGHGQGNDQERLEAMEQHAQNGRGQQGDEHIGHDHLRGQLAADVGAGGNIIKVIHRATLLIVSSWP